MVKQIHPLKDKIVSAALKTALNCKWNAIGEFLKIDLDSSGKKISATLSLKGESCLFDLQLENYSFRRKGDRCLVTIEKIRTSKEWVNALVDVYFRGRELELPVGLLPLLRLFT